ncbi:integrase core domain-containing protein [Glutamicibacter ardleyensis]|uniref:integrase core domain-containing protein n=1 Tax=Glutamicibacter ardleyensis TaxID=225894 RepID=UPI003FCF38FC
MFQKAIKVFGAPRTVHAGSGPAMKSNALENALDFKGVELSHNTPYVSNDNLFSESEFRTMKYPLGYPKVFQTLADTRAYLDEYVPWYNQQHKHSSNALFSPAQVHDGSWHDAWQVRDEALQDYSRKHPARFEARPMMPSPAGIAGNNLPSLTADTELHAA